MLILLNVLNKYEGVHPFTKQARRLFRLRANKYFDYTKIMLVELEV